MGNSKTTKSTAIKFVDDHLPAVVKLIRDKSPEIVPAIRALLNLSRTPVEQDPNGLVFGAGTAAPYLIEMQSSTAQWFMAHVLAKYQVKNPATVQAFIRSEWSHYVPKRDKEAHGQYYTPQHAVKAIGAMVQSALQQFPQAVLLDPAAGAGALLDPFRAHRHVAADIDPIAVTLLNELGFPEVHLGNSLVGASRAKFGIEGTDDLVVVLNAPFNGSKQTKIACDPAYAATDSCVSFLKMVATLEPKAIVSIQPLTTLIKERTFKELASFAMSYRMKTSFVMSSAEFGFGGEEFPLAVVHYVPGAMTFGDVEQFAFPIFKNVAGALVDSGERLQISKVETVKGLIRNMPPKRGEPTQSELDVYQFNFRHINFVKAKGNLADKPSPSMIPVQLADLWKYAYINCFKRHFVTDFVVGNLDPLCRKADFANSDFTDACIYDTIMANGHRMTAFDRANQKSMVLTHGILSNARTKAAAHKGKDINVHQAFVDYWDKGTGKAALSPFFAAYFATLKAANLSNATKPTTAAPAVVAAQIPGSRKGQAS